MNEKRQEAISPKDQQVSELDKLQEHGHGAAMEDYLELYLPCWSQTGTLDGGLLGVRSAARAWIGSLRDP